MSTEKLWRCPVCGRLLATPNQAHSHFNTSIDAHFAGKPQLKILFDYLVLQLEQVGPVRVDAVKTSINLSAKHHLGAVTVLKDKLSLGFMIARPIESPRIVKTEVLGPAKFAYYVYLTSEKDIDSELLGWLKEAYTRAS